MMSCALIFWQLRMTFYLYTCKCQVNEKSGSHQPSQEINQVMCIDPGLEGSQYTCFVYIFLYSLWVLVAVQQATVTDTVVGLIQMSIQRHI